MFAVDIGSRVGVIMIVSKKKTMSIETLNPSATDAVISPRLKDRKLDEGLDRVFEKYGSDLSAFLRDAMDEVAPKSEHIRLDVSRSMYVRR